MNAVRGASLNWLPKCICDVASPLDNYGEMRYGSCMQYFTKLFIMLLAVFCLVPVAEAGRWGPIKPKPKPITKPVPRLGSVRMPQKYTCCPVCNGRGVIMVSVEGEYRSRICGRCGGRGSVRSNPFAKTAQPEKEKKSMTPVKWICFGCCCVGGVFIYRYSRRRKKLKQQHAPSAPELGAC